MLSISTKLDHIHSDTEIADVVSLSFDLRQKSRIRVTLQSGVEAALYMQRGTILRGGDFLQADSGEIIEVNNELQNSPQLLNTDPENTGWYMKIKIDNTEELTNLMNFNQYKETI